MLYGYRIFRSDFKVGNPFNFPVNFTAGSNFQSLIGHISEIRNENFRAVQSGDEADDAGLFAFLVIESRLNFRDTGAFSQTAGNAAVHYRNNFYPARKFDKIGFGERPEGTHPD